MYEYEIIKNNNNRYDLKVYKKEYFYSKNNIIAIFECTEKNICNDIIKQYESKKGN